MVSWQEKEGDGYRNQMILFATQEEASAHVIAIAPTAEMVLMARAEIEYNDPRHVRPPHGRTKGL